MDINFKSDLVCKPKQRRQIIKTTQFCSFEISDFFVQKITIRKLFLLPDLKCYFFLNHIDIQQILWFL